MVERLLNARKILLAIICDNVMELQQQMDTVKAAKFVLPTAGVFEFEARLAIKDRNLAITCNKIRRETDAKYIFFLTALATDFGNAFLTVIFNAFFYYPKVGIAGLMGSEMPISGDFTQAKEIYGSYFYKDEAGNIQRHGGKTFLLYQSVHVLDSGFFATSEDIPFDENIGDDFFLATQCCRYRRAGYDIGVVYSENVDVVFSADKCSYTPKNGDEYAQQLNVFRTRYKDVVTPLVSICIPSYNQPRFFEMALQSALGQTYPNIEIIVGDDSTNEDIKNLIQPYLQRFPNIKYFFHGKPLGKKGLRNMHFIINQSSGAYVNVLLHDDVLGAEKISRMMEYFVRDLKNKITLITSARLLINENNQILRRINPWQPSEDTILSGEEVGRKILFIKENFIGELSTVLLKRTTLLTKDPETGKELFDIGIFCGVKDVAYGDIGTWLNLMKSGGDCVFIKDTLSAFRQHPAQNTYDPIMRIRLYIEFMNYINIAWLNNVFLHNWDEYVFCCKNWALFASESKSIKFETMSNEVRFFRTVIKKFFKLIAEGKYAEVFDYSIRFLLATLPDNNSIHPLVKRNEQTGLWEKADNGVMLYGEQRC